MSSERRASSASLSPPARSGTRDPGAHELESDSDDHFSDAKSDPVEDSSRNSPIPRLRVEKVDDEPSYGEVPGTEAYDKRTEDAAPDEIAIVSADADRPKAEQASEHLSQIVPKTVVDETADEPGSETHNFHSEQRQADAAPDFVRKADGTGEANQFPSSLETTGEAPDTQPPSSALKSPVSQRHRRKSSAARSMHDVGGAGRDNDEDDEFGDDFDEFEEGGEDDDFGDFDNGFQQADSVAAEQAAPASQSAPEPSFPILDLDGLDTEDIISATKPYLDALYPPESLEFPSIPPAPKDNPIFLTDRSASLWSQLVAPPPLQPPDWIRSRIRRLFLVSLGVPVDLDEILPASKQKKLVLPSLQLSTAGSPRTSTDSRPNIARLKQGDGNASSTSLDSKGEPKRSSSKSAASRRKGPPPAPDLNLVSAKQLCTTTNEALQGMTDTELQQHVQNLKDLEILANEALEYWKKRTDDKIGDRETFEGVIENLVKHARKVRK